jgi:hypothetical protein
MRLLIIILSQPLYYSPDEYLLVLNPFSTYFTSRRVKNTKNLFVSLVNTVLSYDCQGYVNELFNTYNVQIGHSIFQCYRLNWRLGAYHYSGAPSSSYSYRVQASFVRKLNISYPWGTFIIEYNKELLPKGISVINRWK